jgi:hypothetical protein
MMLATDRVWGELTLGDVIFFAIILGSLLIPGLYCLARFVIELWKQAHDNRKELVP